MWEPGTLTCGSLGHLQEQHGLWLTGATGPLGRGISVTEGVGRVREVSDSLLLCLPLG